MSLPRELLAVDALPELESRYSAAEEPRTPIETASESRFLVI